MKIILLSFILYLIVHTFFFVYETIYIINNPHPKCSDTTKIQFRDLEIKKHKICLRL